MLSSVKYYVQVKAGIPEKEKQKYKARAAIGRNRTETFVEGLRFWRNLHSIVLVRDPGSCLTAGVLEKRRHSKCFSR